MNIRETTCCGLGEVDNLGGSTLNRMEQMRLFYNWHRAFYVYTMPAPYEPADHLTEFIRNHKLGEVVITEPRLNQNSENMLCVYVWGVDRTAVRELLVKEGKKYREAMDDFPNEPLPKAVPTSPERDYGIVVMDSYRPSEIPSSISFDSATIDPNLRINYHNWRRG